MNPSSQGLTAGEQLNLRVSGLLEVEPLQFSINGYSEYLHVTIGNNPSTYCILSHGGIQSMFNFTFYHVNIQSLITENVNRCKRDTEAH